MNVYMYVCSWLVLVQSFSRCDYLFFSSSKKGNIKFGEKQIIVYIFVEGLCLCTKKRR